MWPCLAQWTSSLFTEHSVILCRQLTSTGWGGRGREVCCRLHVYVPLRFLHGNLDPQWDGTGRWMCWEVLHLGSDEAVMRRVPLQEGTGESWLPLSAPHHVRIQEGGRLHTGEQADQTWGPPAPGSWASRPPNSETEMLIV